MRKKKGKSRWNQKPLWHNFSTLYFLLELPLHKAASVWKTEFAHLVWYTCRGIWDVLTIKRTLRGNLLTVIVSLEERALLLDSGESLVFQFLASRSTCWCKDHTLSYTRLFYFFTFQPVYLSDPSYPTLKKLAERRPDVPIYVGNTERPVFWNLNQSGVQLTNINVVPFGIWQQVCVLSTCLGYPFWDKFEAR